MPGFSLMNSPLGGLRLEDVLALPGATPPIAPPRVGATSPVMNPEQAGPAAVPRVGWRGALDRFNSGTNRFLGRLGERLTPIDPALAAELTPAQLQHLRGDSMLHMGLGMLGATSQGAGFGQALAHGIAGGQQHFQGQLGNHWSIAQHRKKMSEPIRLGRGEVLLDPRTREVVARGDEHDEGAPVAVMGADGKPRYVRRGEALGQQPYFAPKDEAPSSYDEYTRAQRDPRYAQFLKDRRGRGMSVITPDGTTIAIGGDGSSIGPGELTKPTINNLQESIINSTNRLDRLNATLSTYNPEFLRAKGLVAANTTKVKDFLGLGVSEEQRRYLSEYSEFQANAAQDFTQTIKELSGVAVNQAELERAEKTAPSGNDISPTEFEAKARATTKFVTRAIMRANWALRNGIGVRSVDQLAQVMPLEGIDQVFEQRANDIWRQMGGTPEMRAQAIERAKQEFGMVR